MYYSIKDVNVQSLIRTLKELFCTDE
jgi:hypothetical protein